eukprot:g3968.t1
MANAMANAAQRQRVTPDAFDVASCGPGPCESHHGSLDQATVSFSAAGKEPGRNLVGKLLNEPGMPPRCCIVVQVFGEDGAVQHARGRLLDALRSRASAAQGDVRALRRVKWRLSSVLQHRGFYEEALPMLQELLRTGEESEGPESPQALAIANNLALVWEQMGHFAEAEKLHRSTLEVRGRTLGRENPNTLKSVNNLANVLQKMGQFTEAEQLHRRAMEARERALGAEHAETLNSISNLASVLKEMSQYLEAEELTRRVLEARERIFGPEHPNTLLSVNNLANSLKKVGRYEEAEELSRRAVDACERTLGPEHPRTLASLDTLAAILSDLCRYDEAEILSRRAVDSFEKALGPEHPYTLVSLETLAQILANMGQGSDAETLYRRVLTAYERTLGAEHPKTIRSHQSLMALENALPAAQEKFQELRPNLEVLLGHVERVAKTCEEHGKVSEELLHSTEARRNWWFHLLDLLGKILTVGTPRPERESYLGICYNAKSAAYKLAEVTYGAAKKMLAHQAATTQAVAERAAAAKAAAATKAAEVVHQAHGLQAATGSEAATAAASGHGGPKAVLGVLAISGVVDEHQQSREMFQKMASKLRQAASDLKCARDCSEKLEEAFEVVAEAAEELCGMAEDAELIECDYDLDDMNAKLQELFDAAERAVPAFGELQKALLALDEEQNIPLVTEIEESEPEQQESPPEEKHGELPDIEEIRGWSCTRDQVSRSPQRVATSVTLAQRVPSGLPSVLLADGAPRGPLCSAAPPTWTVPRPLRNLPWQVAALEEQRKQTPMQNASELRMVQRSSLIVVQAYQQIAASFYT